MSMGLMPDRMDKGETASTSQLKIVPIRLMTNERNLKKET